MGILTKYVLRVHLGPFVFALSVLTGMLLINTVAQRFAELAGKGLPAGVIAEVFALSVPHIVALTLPMAVLVAVLYTFSQLAAENEVTALKASGVNLVRLLVPLLAAAAVLAGGMVWFNDRVLPETNHRLKNLLIDIGRKSPTLELKEQMINEIQTGDLRSRYYLQAAVIEPATNRLRDVVIYDLSAADRDRTIYADSGRMAFSPERTDLFLTLHDGFIHQMDGTDPKTFQRLFFNRQLVRIRGIGNRLERSGDEYRGDREMSLGMLQNEVRQRGAELMQVRQQLEAAATTALEQAQRSPGGERAAAVIRRAVEEPDAPLQELLGLGGPISASGASGLDETTRRAVSELRTLQSRADMLQHEMSRYSVEYHKKFAIPFACLVFVLIGVPLAVRFPRGGVGMVIAASLAIFGVYYMGLIGGEELADRRIVSSFWAMWAANALFLALSLWGVSRVGREVSTTRGGGWDDLFETTRNFALRPVRYVFRRRAA